MRSVWTWMMVGVVGALLAGCNERLRRLPVQQWDAGDGALPAYCAPPCFGVADGGQARDAAAMEDDGDGEED